MGSHIRFDPRIGVGLALCLGTLLGLPASGESQDEKKRSNNSPHEFLRIGRTSRGKPPPAGGGFAKSGLTTLAASLRSAFAVIGEVAASAAAAVLLPAALLAFAAAFSMLLPAPLLVILLVALLAGADVLFVRATSICHDRSPFWYCLRGLRQPELPPGDGVPA